MIAALGAIAPQLDQVRAAMSAAVASREPKVDRLIADLGGFHGKMLRPSLVLLCARAAGGPIDRRHIALGAAMELIHTATLVHDDLIDDADTRRGRPTAHTRFGNTTAILIGDHLYTRAFHLAASLGDGPLMQRLTAATNILCEGELHQQVCARDPQVDQAEYERIAYAKTAALTELSGWCGAIHAPGAVQDACAAYGRACGIAFQIADDVLDLDGDAEKVGKSLATDLDQGRVTLPIICTLARLAPAERAEGERILLHARSDADIAQARDLVRRHGGSAAALARAREHIRAGQAALAVLAASPARAALHDLAEFIIDRDR